MTCLCSLWAQCQVLSFTSSDWIHFSSIVMAATLGPRSSMNSSSTFESPPTTSFLSLVHKKFMEVVTLLCLQVEIPSFCLTLHINFGEGRTISATMSAEPLSRLSPPDFQPGRICLTFHLSSFFHWVHGRFQSLLYTMAHFGMVQYGQSISLVLDMSIGFVASMTNTFRITLTRPIHLGMDGTNDGHEAPGARGATDVAGGGSITIPLFIPIPRGTDLTHFWGPMGNHGDVTNSQTSHPEMSSSESESDSQMYPDSNASWAPDWQPIRPGQSFNFRY